MIEPCQIWWNLEGHDTILIQEANEVHEHLRICYTYKTMRCTYSTVWITSVICQTGAGSEPYYSWSKRWPQCPYGYLLWEWDVYSKPFHGIGVTILDWLSAWYVCMLLFVYAYLTFIQPGEDRIWNCQKLLMNMWNFKTSTVYPIDFRMIRQSCIWVLCSYIIIQRLYITIHHYTSP